MKNSYILSIRGKPPYTPIEDLVNLFNKPLIQIESVFGFVEQSTLYGGRPFSMREISESDITWLKQNGITLRLPLSNSYVCKCEYDKSREFLDKYYELGASVIVTNDDFASWLRRDYPNMIIEASAIKNIDSIEKVKKALDLYDSIVLPSKVNDNDEFLDALPEKDRIILFGNTGCAFNCPSKICYPAVSKMNKYIGADYKCSQPLIARDLKFTEFRLSKFNDMGFYRFKMLRSKGTTGS